MDLPLDAPGQGILNQITDQDPEQSQYRRHYQPSGGVQSPDAPPRRYHTENGDEEDHALPPKDERPVFPVEPAGRFFKEQGETPAHRKPASQKDETGYCQPKPGRTSIEHPENGSEVAIGGAKNQAFLAGPERRIVPGVPPDQQVGREHRRHKANESSRTGKHQRGHQSRHSALLQPPAAEYPDRQGAKQQGCAEDYRGLGDQPRPARFPNHDREQEQESGDPGDPEPSGRGKARAGRIRGNSHRP